MKSQWTGRARVDLVWKLLFRYWEKLPIKIQHVDRRKINIFNVWTNFRLRMREREESEKPQTNAVSSSQTFEVVTFFILFCCFELIARAFSLSSMVHNGWMGINTREMFIFAIWLLLYAVRLRSRCGAAGTDKSDGDFSLWPQLKFKSRSTVYLRRTLMDFFIHFHFGLSISHLGDASSCQFDEWKSFSIHDWNNGRMLEGGDQHFAHNSWVGWKERITVRISVFPQNEFRPLKIIFVAIFPHQWSGGSTVGVEGSTKEIQWRW